MMDPAHKVETPAQPEFQLADMYDLKNQILIALECRFTDRIGLRMIHNKTSCWILHAGDFGLTIAAESPAGRLLHQP